MTCKQGFWMEDDGLLGERLCESEGAVARARVCVRAEHPRVERSELAQTLSSSGARRDNVAL